jgi:hypothetical protein
MATPDPATDKFTVAVRSGDMVFREGDTGSELFLIEEGRVELTVANPPRTYTLEVGDFFGERALVYDQRDASAKALSACRLIKIDRATFTAIVKVHPEIALMMLRSLPRGGGVAAASAPTGVFIHSASNTRFPLEGTDLLIGRSSKASGYTADVDLQSFDPDKTLSRKHARITRTADGFMLREEEGRNGPFVNGSRIRPGQTVRLEEGDRIRFGLVEVVFRAK